jgi:hypothetical protein
MDPKQDFIDRILPYRLEAVEILGLALRYRMSWDGPVPMNIHFDGNLSIEGSSTAFTNPAIEAGIIHCRALLEFLGLRADPTDHGRLSPRSSSRRGDLMIEDFANADGQLSPVTPAEAVAPYAGPPGEAQRALARVIHVANKGLAHSTVGLINDPDDLRLSEIASRGVRALLVNHFYTPLGLVAPTERLSSRKRDAG